VHAQIGKKQLLASSCLSICLSLSPSALNDSAPTGQIFMKFMIGIFSAKSVEKVQV